MTKDPVLQVEHEGFKYRYAVPNEHCEWRVRSMFTKEPDTIKWLSEMKPSELLLDVGANVGIYTIFAAVRGIKVFAFEPEAQNYAILCRNIFLNEVDVLAYCVALSNKEGPNKLYLSGYLPGGSCHSFGESVDHRLMHSERKFVQGSIGYYLDSFGMTPDYIKIDVDGFEHHVMEGGKRSIKNAKSVLIEINTALPEHMNVVEKMLEWGFSYNPDQVEQAQRKEGTFRGCGNYIFYR